MPRVRHTSGRTARMELPYASGLTTYANIREWLEFAESSGKLPTVALHLVGAMLQLRFPHLPVPNEAAVPSEDDERRVSRYRIGNTVFHVTIEVGRPVIEECRVAIHRGQRGYLLVPEVAAFAARDFVEYGCRDMITVVSIESFVSINIELISEFQQGRSTQNLRRLLEMYNERVDTVETDKSLLVEIPAKL